MKLIVLIIIGILMITCVSIVYTFLSNQPVEKEEYSDYSNGSFYGPVPQGYNQSHYWKTGETIREEIKR